MTNPYTILDLLDAIGEADGLIELDNPMFEYSRIGAKQVEDTQDGEESLKFVPSPVLHGKGFSISALVLNEDRPNISMRVVKAGTVDLSSRISKLTPPMPDDLLGLPSFERFPTFIWRNYTIVRDGQVHVDLLPVRFLLARWEKIKAPDMPVVGTTGEGDEIRIVFDLRKLPVVNKLESFIPQTLFVMSYELTKARAKQKVYKHYAEIARERAGFTKHAAAHGWFKTFGAEVAKFLEDQGLTASGFSPGRRVVKSGDCYLSKELPVSIRSFNALAKVEEVRERMLTKTKLTPSMELMEPYIEAAETILAAVPEKFSFGVSAARGQFTPEQAASMIEKEAEACILDVRRKLFEIARMKYALIASDEWLDVKMTIETDGRRLECKAETTEKKIET